MKGIDQLLAEHDLFRGLDPETLALLAGCASNMVVQQGEHLFAEGEEADRFWVIRQGRVGLEVAVPGLGRRILETVGGDSVVGWSWLVAPYRWRFDAVAEETTRAVVFDVRCLRSKMDADPRIGYEIMSRFLPIILDRLQSTRLRLLDVYAPPVRATDGH